MRKSLLLIATFAAGPACAAEPINVSTDRADTRIAAQEAINIYMVDAAYPALVARDNAAAIQSLSDRLADERDPSRLINLGTALVRVGRRDEAAAMFRRAMTSRVRYDLELADGRFQDSRWTARSALAQLMTVPTQLAAR